MAFQLLIPVEDDIDLAGRNGVLRGDYTEKPKLVTGNSDTGSGN
jgi:hypothetical protein